MNAEQIYLNWAERDASAYLARNPSQKHLELHLLHIDRLLPKLGGREFATMQAYRAALVAAWANGHSARED